MKKKKKKKVGDDDEEEEAEVEEIRGEENQELGKKTKKEKEKKIY